jgi:hypothetical protein
MLSERLRTRLEQHEAVFQILDRRRAETGDLNVGTADPSDRSPLVVARTGCATPLQECSRLLRAGTGRQAAG